MSVQTIVNREAGSPVANNPVLSQAQGSSQTISTPMPIAGSFSNWQIRLSVAPGGVTSRTLTLHKNDVATAVTVTITGAATTGSDTTHSVSYAIGDTLRWSHTASGSPAIAVVSFSIDFTPTTADMSIYGWSSAGVTANAFAGPFHGSGFTPTTAFPGSQISAMSGNITDLRWRVGTSPGVGNSRIATIFLNGVAQDGSGGTPDTRATISGANTSAASAFSLAIAPFDVLTVKHTTSGSPTGITWSCGAIAVAATFAGQYQFGCVQTGSSTSTKFQTPIGQTLIGDSATESDVDIIGGITNIAIGGIYMELSGAPSAGKSWTATLRVNGSDSALAVTVADAATTGFTAASPVTITTSDTWSIKITSSGSPGAPSADRHISLLVGTVGGPSGQPTMRRWGGSIAPQGAQKIGRSW